LHKAKWEEGEEGKAKRNWWSIYRKHIQKETDFWRAKGPVDENACGITSAIEKDRRPQRTKRDGILRKSGDDIWRSLEGSDYGSIGAEGKPV